MACTGGKLDSTEQHLCIKHIGSTVCCVVRTAAVALQMHNLGVLPARSDAGHQTDAFHEKGMGWRGGLEILHWTGMSNTANYNHAHLQPSDTTR